MAYGQYALTVEFHQLTTFCHTTQLKPGQQRPKYIGQATHPSFSCRLTVPLGPPPAPALCTRARGWRPRSVPGCPARGHRSGVTSGSRSPLGKHHTENVRVGADAHCERPRAPGRVGRRRPTAANIGQYWAISGNIGQFRTRPGNLE